MSYTKDRDEFILAIVKELASADNAPKILAEISGTPVAPGEFMDKITTSAASLARLILRNAATVQRLAVEDCNRPLSDGERKQWAAAEARIVAACKPWGIVAKTSGDPRGASVKLLLPSGRSNSWGGAEGGFCVPTR